MPAVQHNGDVTPVRRFFRELSRFSIAFLIVAVLTPAATAGVLLATNLFVPLPSVIPEPEQLDAIQFSNVYDANGTVIHTYKQFDQNIPVTMGDIPAVMKNAVIAAEDRNFYNHGGVDVRGTMRALVTDVRQGELAEGGSTITQQLAKNAYGIGSDRTISRKIKEAILASQLDRSLPKEQILFQYLSIVYFGEGAYGIGAAAQVYFQKPVNDLTISESATLAGLIPAPSRFNPRTDPATAEIRRKQVLNAMLEEDLITQAEYDVALAEVIWPDTQGPPPGPATIVRSPQVEGTRYPWFIQYLTSYLAEEFGSEDLLYRGGLDIYTTLDPIVQAEAEATVAETVDGQDVIVTKDENGVDVPHVLQASITAIEPPTGFVRAMVGGREFGPGSTGLSTEANLSAGIGTPGRQVGSSFKPFVLAEAFEQGITPDSVYSGGPLTIGDYSPTNFGGAVYGDMTLREATEKSVNTVFVRLMDEVGPDAVVALANRTGLRIPEIDPTIDGSGLSIGLGSRSIPTMDMASGYATFANGGVHVAPTPVVRVFDPEGALLLDRSEPDGEQAIKAATADNVTDVLRGVISSGTASGRGINRPAAGKTGTTNDNRDGWFVGYTPTLSTAVFVGYDPPESLRVKGVALTGGSAPARAWQRFMRAALANVPVTDFNEPAPIVKPASEELQRERRGFGPGTRDNIASTSDGGPYVEDLEAPIAPVPTNPTTSTSSTTQLDSSSTSTTREDDDGFGLFGDGDG